MHWRAPETATSTASTESAILDFVGAHPDYDILCLIQATSPFIAPDDFIQGVELLQSTGADSLVTAVRAHRFLWLGLGLGLANLTLTLTLSEP